jgi:hypothetical protein
MRKILFPLLMASVLMPAAAYAEPGNRGGREHRERSGSDDNSSDSRPQHVQRIERSNSDAPRVNVERSQRSQRVERSVEAQTSEPTRVRRFERHEESTQPVQQVEQVERVRRVNRSNDGFVGAITRTGREQTAHEQGDVQVRRDRDGFSGLHDRIVRNGDRTDSHHRWSGDWRKDHRYDWRSYRNRYGSLYRLGRYYDPYGWNYRRFSIGFSLWPSYYGSSFWLNDPWQYRLPPAYGPYRWVRYYDDALLVNIYTGQVVDVIYNVFW